MPAMPRAAAARRVSTGKVLSRSQSRAWGAICSAAKPSAISRIAVRSSSSPKLIGRYSEGQNRRFPLPPVGRGQGWGVVQEAPRRSTLHHPHLRLLPAKRRRAREFPPQRGRVLAQRIVGIENSAPVLMPLGQRCVTVLVLV